MYAPALSCAGRRKVIQWNKKIYEKKCKHTKVCVCLVGIGGGWRVGGVVEEDLEQEALNTNV